MCWPELAIATVGAGLSAAGSAQNNSENTANAQAQAAARNGVLVEQMNKNNVLSNESRGTFNGRLDQVQPSAMATQQGDLTSQRADSITSNLPTINPTNFGGAVDTSTAVKSAVAKAVDDALSAATDRANATAKLGGYGDLFMRQGLADQAAKDNISTDINFAQANNTLTPQLQDLAAAGAYKPNSGLGGILQGLGSAFGSYAGSQAGKT